VQRSPNVVGNSGANINEDPTRAVGFSYKFKETVGDNVTKKPIGVGRRGGEGSAVEVVNG
jgi:hypothetical protein